MIRTSAISRCSMAGVPEPTTSSSPAPARKMDPDPASMVLSTTEPFTTTEPSPLTTVMPLPDLTVVLLSVVVTTVSVGGAIGASRIDQLCAAAALGARTQGDSERNHRR